MSKITMDSMRSFVRIGVTYVAAAFAFGGGGYLIYWILTTEEFDETRFNAAKDLFMLILPVATGIITYWFASRGKKNDASPTETGKHNDASNK